MTQNYRKQQGSVHAIIIIILVVALLGALGFIFWQNVIKNQSNSGNTSTTSTNDNKNKEAYDYETDEYAFNYPAGWRLVEEKSLVEGDDQTYPSVQSSDYEHNIGMGVKTGGVVEVYVSPLGEGETVDKAVEAAKELPYLSDVKKVSIDGADAYSFKTCYEGCRISTVIYHESKSYTIEYQYNDDSEAYDAAYKEIVASFSFL